MPSQPVCSRAALIGDGLKVTGPNLWFPSVSCENPRFSAKTQRFLAVQGAAKGGRQKKVGKRSSITFLVLGTLLVTFWFLFWSFCHFFRPFFAKRLLPYSFVAAIFGGFLRTASVNRRIPSTLKFNKLIPQTICWCNGGHYTN